MIWEIIKLLRIPHWIKNAFVFIPIIFARQIFNADKLIPTILIFLLFSLISSSVYVFNDIRDCEEDKKHEQKKLRPVASGIISTTNAYIIFILLLTVSLVFTQIFNKSVIIILSIYF